MLSAIQQEVARVISRELSETDFALAGGAALILLGIVTRETRDLDFFGTSIDQLNSRLPSVIRALEDAGMDVVIKRQSETFVRLDVGIDEEFTEVDLALDARLFPAMSGEFAPVLTTSELAVDKVLAVFGRAEPRDFTDLVSLTQYFELSHLLNLAKSKDLGFDEVVFASMSERIEVFTPETMGVTEDQFEELKIEVMRWRSVVNERQRDRGRDTGHTR